MVFADLNAVSDNWLDYFGAALPSNKVHIKSRLFVDGQRYRQTIKVLKSVRFSLAVKACNFCCLLTNEHIRNG